ncbi:8-amino-7-oxononanoate synthase [Neobacillus sp. DY30]|uniref:8-amino-7-oxononanoate synthase n=1 Tax=Neobacillus sp. DY30 TaxID=3047871 RepID=UPI0024C0BB7E|nr:8-amino-7-oxononanoate synthase [Neobacillus sp. DY30]WHY00910.1 8-amino-7-oxononanoate synthase [Neobacillus sp. DY30]
MTIWEQELDSIKNEGLYRQLKLVEIIGDEGYAMVNGQSMLMFASNNYLGLASDHRLIRASIEATNQLGTGSTGSRLTTGNTSLHEKLEERIASFKETEAAILFNTGYMANIAALTTLVGKEDVILSDEWNHACIIDGCRLSRGQTMVYRHADLEDLESKLKEADHFRRRLIVTDGVFSMDGDIAPLPGIIELAKRYNALVMVDDAHATGVLGKDGRGTAEYFGLTGEVDIHMGTLSKAMGAEGGYIAGSRSLVDYLMNRARPFIYSTSLPPGVVASALTAIDIIKSEHVRRVRLHYISERLRQALTALGYHVLGGQTPILSVMSGQVDEAMKLSQALYENGIFAPAIRPPTVPVGTSRIRLTVMATHQDKHIDQVIQVFKKLAAK